MDEKKYECNSCGYLFWVKPEKGKTPACPNCRSLAFEAEYPLPDEFLRYECDECGAVFHVPVDAISPYKCPCCNRTIPDTPDRINRHKL